MLSQVSCYGNNMHSYERLENPSVQAPDLMVSKLKQQSKTRVKRVNLLVLLGCRSEPGG